MKTKMMTAFGLCLAAVVLFASAYAYADGDGTDSGYAALGSGVNNNQGEYSAYTYTFNFAFEGTDAQSILWDFGFTDVNGMPATSTAWNPSNVTFPAKGTYIVTQMVTNTVGSFVSTLTVIVLGTPEVVFDSNGGSEITMQYVKVGLTATEPADPVREGYTFTGWYSDPELETEYDFSAPVSEHITLYADWTPAPASDDGCKFPLIPVVLGLFGLILLAGAYFLSKKKNIEEKRLIRLGFGGVILLALAFALYMVGVTDVDSIFRLLERGT